MQNAISIQRLRGGGGTAWYAGTRGERSAPPASRKVLPQSQRSPAAPVLAAAPLSTGRRAGRECAAPASAALEGAAGRWAAASLRGDRSRAQRVARRASVRPSKRIRDDDRTDSSLPTGTVPMGVLATLPTLAGPNGRRRDRGRAGWPSAGASPTRRWCSTPYHKPVSK